jgi:antitoxin component YwqK of YwqJK toxin-antitoxin module
MDKGYLWLEEKNPYLAFKLSMSEKKSTIHFPKISFRIKPDTEVLYIQGVLRCFDTVAEFLERGGLVVFIEPNVEKIEAFLALREFPLEEGLEIILPEEGQYTQVAWKHLFLKSQYIGELDPLIEVKDTIHMIASDYRDGGKTVLRNIQLNLLRTNTCTDGRSLKGALQGRPIVVCGSGASLESSLEKLRQVEEKVCILATGSSIPILAKAKIRIDFGAFIDPDPPLERYREMESFAFPLFYQNRTSEALLQLHQGEKIWMGESGGWALEDWIYQEVGIPHFQFDSGWNVGCFGVHIAQFLGGGPIILLGLDSSMEEIRALEEGEFLKEGQITRRDLYGTVQWMDDFVSKNPSTTFIQGFEHLKMPGCRVDLAWEKNLTAVAKEIEFSKETLAIDGCLVKKAIAKIHAPDFTKELEEFLQALSIGVDKKGFDLAYAKLECFVSGEPFYEYLVTPLWGIFQEFYLRKVPLGPPPEVRIALAKVSFFQMLCIETLLKETKFFDDPLSKTIYVEGKIEGEVTRFYESGAIAAREYYAASQPMGRWEMFYETGEVKSVVDFALGKLHGQFDLFHKTGKKRSGIFNLGKKEGRHTIHNVNGKALFDASFQANVPSGTWKRYSYGGELVEETTYLEDLRFNRKEYTLEGKLKYEGVFEGDLFVEKRFYENGELERREGVWKEGKIVWN